MWSIIIFPCQFSGIRYTLISEKPSSMIHWINPSYWWNHSWNHVWLVVWTPLKNMSQLGWLSPIYGKIKNVPNHPPDIFHASSRNFAGQSSGFIARSFLHLHVTLRRRLWRGLGTRGDELLHGKGLLQQRFQFFQLHVCLIVEDVSEEIGSNEVETEKKLRKNEKTS